MKRKLPHPSSAQKSRGELLFTMILTADADALKTATESNFYPINTSHPNGQSLLDAAFERLRRAVSSNNFSEITKAQEIILLMVKKGAATNAFGTKAVNETERLEEIKIALENIAITNSAVEVFQTGIDSYETISEEKLERDKAYQKPFYDLITRIDALTPHKTPLRFEDADALKTATESNFYPINTSHPNGQSLLDAAFERLKRAVSSNNFSEITEAQEIILLMIEKGAATNAFGAKATNETERLKEIKIALENIARTNSAVEVFQTGIDSYETISEENLERAKAYQKPFYDLIKRINALTPPKIPLRSKDYSSTIANSKNFAESLQNLINNNQYDQAFHIANNYQNEDGLSMLHIAAKNNDITLTNLLVNIIGINNINAQDKNEKTALDYARSAQIKFLLTKKFASLSKDLPKTAPTKDSDNPRIIKNNVPVEEVSRSAYETVRQMLIIEQNLNKLKPSFLSSVLSRPKKTPEILNLEKKFADLENKLKNLDLRQAIVIDGRYRTALDLVGIEAFSKTKTAQIIKLQQQLKTGSEIRQEELQQQSAKEKLAEEISAISETDIENFQTELANLTRNINFDIKDPRFSLAIQTAFLTMENNLFTQYCQKLTSSEAFLKSISNYRQDPQDENYSKLMAEAQKAIKATSQTSTNSSKAQQDLERDEIKITARRFAQNACDNLYKTFIKSKDVPIIKIEEPFSLKTKLPPQPDQLEILAQAEEILWSNQTNNIQKTTALFKIYQNNPSLRQDLLEIKDLNGNSLASYAKRFNPEAFKNLIDGGLITEKDIPDFTQTGNSPKITASTHLKIPQQTTTEISA